MLVDFFNGKGLHECRGKKVTVEQGGKCQKVRLII
jgi:hypothetical protein